eukprot:597903-Rhodomonas_salina.1
MVGGRGEVEEGGKRVGGCVCVDLGGRGGVGGRRRLGRALRHARRRERTRARCLCSLCGRVGGALARTCVWMAPRSSCQRACDPPQRDLLHHPPPSCHSIHVHSELRAPPACACDQRAASCTPKSSSRPRTLSAKCARSELSGL